MLETCYICVKGFFSDFGHFLAGRALCKIPHMLNGALRHSNRKKTEQMESRNRPTTPHQLTSLKTVEYLSSG